MAASWTRSTTRRNRDLLLAALAGILLLALALVVAGCGSSNDNSNTGSTASASGPSELRMGYQAIPNMEMIVKNQGWLEAALPGTTVKWIKFDSGADVNTAMIAGSIDMGLAGSSPVAAGLSDPMNIPYQVPWIHDVIGAAESLCVKNSAGVTDLKGLVGKKVGTPFGSTAHYSLLAALELNGVDPKKVDIVDLQPPDILAAWQRGDIDAAYVWNPTLADLKKDGKILITSADLAKQGKLTADLAVVSKAFGLYNSDPQTAAADVGKELNLSADEALAQMKDLIFLDATQQASAQYLGTPGSPGKLADNLLSAAEFLKAQQSVQGVKPLSDYQAGLANQFVAKASGQ
jgi:taurine transport system substrate-binding protein